MPLLENRGTSQTTYTPEQRMLANERKRVSGFIRDYQRNPKKWNKGMIETLERLALQYQIPFKRAVPTAGVGAHIAAGMGGLVDSIAFDLIPDNWYSDESTRTTANASKIVGYVGQVAAAAAATVLSGGAASPALGASIANVARAGTAAVRGATGIAKVGAAARGMGHLGLNIMSKGIPGRLTTAGIKGIKAGMQPYGVQQGWKWAQAAQTAAGKEATKTVMKNAKSVIKDGGNLGAVVKGANLDTKKITTLTNAIIKKYGDQKAGKELIRQLMTGAKGTEPIAGLSSASFAKIVDKISLVGNPNVSIKAVQKVAKAAKITLTKKQAEAITNNLMKNNITKMRDAIPHLMSMGGSPAAQAAELTARSLGNMNTLMGAGGLGIVGAKATDLYRPSRDELEAAQDPYDPYNVQINGV